MQSTMPIYEYQCDQCGETVERLQNKASAAPPGVCKACGAKESMHRIMSKTSFQLKGGGWYVTDYKPSAPGPASEQKDAKAPETSAPPVGTPEAAPAAADSPAAPAPKGGAEST